LADKTWADDLLPFITGELPKPARVHDDVYVRRVNIAIGIINDRAGGFESRWVNDGAAGSIVLSGATCTFPGDLLDARTIHWDGSEIHFKTVEQLEALDEDWRTRTGTPSYFTLTARGFVMDGNPGSDEGSDLEAWGSGCIPEQEFGVDSVTGVEPLNPFAYLRAPDQMAPAFYVLGNVPLYGRMREDVFAIQQDYRQQWQAFLEGVVWGVITRKYPKISS